MITDTVIDRDNRTPPEYTECTTRKKFKYV